MNYIRGAVNVISAPYQYYKDLPPINPATLTGAIDVIVIQRPTDSGGSELVCSPFHVRFGKWQVLRPAEKKVNVSVNGHPIPYNMKVGEAGEAFFVFETEDDVPADLITSPLLQPTHPEDSANIDLAKDRFGAKRDASSAESGDFKLKTEEKSVEDVQEPEFLDLNSSPSLEEESRLVKPVDESETPTRPTLTIPQSVQSLPSPPPSPTKQAHVPSSATPSSLLSRTGRHGNSSTAEDAPAKRVDQVVDGVEMHIDIPNVKYKDGIVLDAGGYHAHSREVSGKTITPSDSGTDVISTSSSPNQTPQASRSPSPDPASTSSAPSVLFPILRATSEPPPDLDSDVPQGRDENALEYSWEWGAFPQPSPMKSASGQWPERITTGKESSATWSKGGRRGKSRLRPLLTKTGEEEKGDIHGRSRSVPPEAEGSPTRERREVGLPPVYPSNGEETLWHPDSKNANFGEGGRIKADRLDPTRFSVVIEGKMSEFELSLVNPDVDDANTSGRGRRNRDGATGGVRLFDERDEVEAARLFEQGKVDYNTFLDREEIVADDRLVIRWAGDQYIARHDGSPLMDALTIWRNSALRDRENGVSRPVSPSAEIDMSAAATYSEDDLPTADERQSHSRSKSEPPEKPPIRKPTSTSWVQWWSRSSNTKQDATERPSLRGAASAPSAPGVAPVDQPDEESSQTQDIPASESAPAFPSSPVLKTPATAVPPPQVKKFVKTLRLSSDQLKSLNLKSGANSITFSLSASGVIACTARIFLWDSTDLVVVSDIDGTITKSDGLGHVFAMIGRDWTHLGVAKLYTDIVRNGYKIMYLTSRAIGQADATRDYLKGIKQNDYQLPEGPVIMSPDRLMASLHREVIMRKPEVFKMACLRDIQRLFGEASRNPFYAGFGNRITDALSYRSVNVPSARIFTIDSTGEVKMELLELAGYKSSYIHMTDLVDQMFPPIHRKWAPEFTDFNYWKAPVQEFALPDLAPPSPALSARSDTSNQSTLARLRNFSLVGNRQTNNMKQFTFPTAPADEKQPGERGTALRQMSSFERLSNTLAGFTASSRSVSPESHSSSSQTYADSGSDDEYGEDQLGRKLVRRRERRTSMPGSLDDINFGLDDDIGDNDTEQGAEEEHVSTDLEDNDSEHEEEAFDEDLLAAGEMKDVPFL